MNYGFDSEVFHKFFCLCAVDDNGGEHVVKSHGGFINKNEVGEMVGNMYRTADLMCSYNGLQYDIRVIAYILAYPSATVPCVDVKQFSDALIGGGDVPYVNIFESDWLTWRTKHLDILGAYTLNKSLKHWELYRGWSVRETNIDFSVERDLTAEEENDTISYCLADCGATLKLFQEDACQKAVVVRKVLVNEIAKVKQQIIPMDWPQAKLAEEFIYAEDDDIPEGRDLGAADLVPWDSFDVPQDLKDTLKEIATLGGFKPYKEKHGMKTGDKLLWNGLSFGEGGCHYAAKGMHHNVNLFDVNSLYPSILVNWQMWKTPAANHRYGSCYYTRLVDKGVFTEVPAGYTKIEFAGVDTSFLKDALKLILNAPTGKLRQQFYTKGQDKAVGLAMCLIGELIITEAALKATDGHLERLVEVNTDSFGVSAEEDVARALEYIKHTREKWPTIAFAHEFDEDGNNEHGCCEFWADVNDYCTFFPDGSYKFKGADGADLTKKKHEPIIAKSLASTLLNNKIGLEESDVFEDYIYKFSKSAGVKNFTIGGKPCDKKHVYFLWTSEEVGEDVAFSADRVNIQGVVKVRHGVYGFSPEDLRPYFKYVDRKQYEEDLKLVVMIWNPDLVSGFREEFRSKRQKSKREFIAKLPTLKYLHYRTCENALIAENYLIELGWNFQP